MGTPASEITTSKVGHFYPALDGLRAVAILLVFLFHYTSGSVFGWGWIGVDLFFVLSGFLITGILVENRNQEHKLRNFYARRTLRIFPLYIAVWLAVLITYPLFHWRWPRGGYLWPLYLGNFMVLLPRFVGQTTDLFYPSVLGRQTAPLQVGHFWSLCVEEQFYLVWPLIVILVGKCRSLLRISVGVIISASLARILLTIFVPLSWRSVALLLYENPFTRVDSLMWGSLLAILLRSRPHLLRRHGRLLLVTMTASLLIFCTAWTATGHDPGNLHETVPMLLGLPIIDVFSVSLILELTNNDSPLSKVLCWSPARSLGTISYGFYVFHYLFLQMITAMIKHLLPLHLGHAKVWQTTMVVICGFMLSLVMAKLSYVCLERPFIALKRYF